VTALAHPFDWHLEIFWAVAIPALLVAYLLATRKEEYRATRRQRTCFFLGVLALVVAFMWPLADLAARWSLLALVAQRLLLMLAVPPLLVVGTPRPILAHLTRPPAVDAVLRQATKPVPAILFVTVIAVGTLTTGVVTLAARSEVARVGIQLLVLLSGFVLWAPVLTELPGVKPLSSVGRGAYLIVQSIVPSFLSVVWIFARRPLYASYDHHEAVLGMSSVLDQQLAGFLAKLCTIAVLWTVAFSLMTRSHDAAGAEEDAEPLLWSDVEREIQRADRRALRTRSAWLPRTTLPESPNPEGTNPPENYPPPPEPPA
jgi:cytochrome c oxidase assembly factor CtaG